MAGQFAITLAGFQMDVRRFACAVAFLLAAITARGQSQKPEEWLSEAEAAYGKVTGYVAVFHKQQSIEGKLRPEETILLKFRKPFSLYMKWIRAPFKGSELLYVAGWNKDRIRAHRGGLRRFITRNVDPNDPRLLEDNLRPVTSTGIGYLLETAAINIRKATKLGELTFSVGVQEELYGRTTRVIEARFPSDKSQEYDGRSLIINQDVETNLLIAIKIYDRNGDLVEKYAYENLNIDAPLGDADFDPNNPEYHFSTPTGE